MCVGCAMTAMAGASGARTWLQTHHLDWLTPKRLRALTASMFVVALLVSSLGLSGSSKPTHPAHHAAVTAVAVAPHSR
jgi:hypothetical protein